MSKKTRTVTMTDDKVANFKNFATMRTNRALAAIRVIGNCGNRSNYAPDAESIKAIKAELLKAVDDAVYQLEHGKVSSGPTFRLK